MLQEINVIYSKKKKNSEKEAKEFANNIGAVFQLTSCKESIGTD